MNIRKEIAHRLKYELGRRNITAGQAEGLSGISARVINNYLAGDREIKFPEIGAVCNPDGHLKIPHPWPGQNPPP